MIKHTCREHNMRVNQLSKQALMVKEDLIQVIEIKENHAVAKFSIPMSESLVPSLFL